jgi:integrase/recombinase XerD
VTRLRQIMLEELRRRNYAESSIHIYIHTVEHFSRHFHRSPDQLGSQHIRQDQAALFTRWKLAPNTVTQRLAALGFLLCTGVEARLERCGITTPGIRSLMPNF